MSGHLGKQAAESFPEKRAGLQLAQGHHSSDPHPAILLLDPVQAQVTQVDERTDPLFPKAKPAASTQNGAAALLVEFQCLL